MLLTSLKKKHKLLKHWTAIRRSKASRSRHKKGIIREDSLSPPGNFRVKMKESEKIERYQSGVKVNPALENIYKGCPYSG